MVATKTKPAGLTECLNITYNFFKLCETNLNRGDTPPLSDWENYLAKNFILSCNGEIKCKSSKDYAHRYHHLQEKYTTFKISKPLHEPLYIDNHLIIYYSIDITTHAGKKSQILIMAIGLFDNGKIAKWTEVVHEKSSGELDE